MQRSALFSSRRLQPEQAARRLRAAADRERWCLVTRNVMGYTPFRDSNIPSQGPSQVLCDGIAGWDPGTACGTVEPDLGNTECCYDARRYGLAGSETSPLEGRA
jgi:hypothetical protein